MQLVVMKITDIFFVGAEPKYSPSKVMQVTKCITARQIFKQYPKSKNGLRVANFEVIEVTLEL